MPAPRRTAGLVAGALLLAGCGAAWSPSAAPPAARSTATPTTVATSLPVGSPATPSAATVPPSPAPPPGPDPPVVVVDPGHNGGNAAAPERINRQVPDGRGGTKACNTTGTSTDAGYPEHAFAFDVAQRVAERLTTRGVRVVLTRSDDGGVGPCVDERGRSGERAAAEAVVSVHADGAGPRDRGFHVAYSAPPLNAAQRGPALALATDLRDALGDAGFPASDYVGRAGLSPRTDLAGLNLATRPTALVECANMRNAAEAALVSSPEGRDRYAAAIADGVLRFLAR